MQKPMWNIVGRLFDSRRLHHKGGSLVAHPNHFFPFHFLSLMTPPLFFVVSLY